MPNKRLQRSPRSESLIVLFQCKATAVTSCDFDYIAVLSVLGALCGFLNHCRESTAEGVEDAEDRLV
jgi:hypothetical protein